MQNAVNSENSYLVPRLNSVEILALMGGLRVHHLKVKDTGNGFPVLLAVWVQFLFGAFLFCLFYFTSYRS
jgi:hypothetical protein